MDYTSLIAAKGTAGSIANWVNYTKLDTVTILAEAQALLYGGLRTREMRTRRLFSLAVGTADLSLPTGFLDPIGAIRFPTINYRAPMRDQSSVRDARSYNPTSGTLGTNPFTTVNGSTSVNVALANHALSQASVFSASGAATFNNVSITGAFPVTAIVDANTFTIDISALATVPNANGAGGGASVAFSADSLIQGIPTFFSIWDEAIHFDVALAQAISAELHFFKSPALLSSTNTTNFLTNRYPHLLRTACQASAADFMKDNEEYQKALTRLSALIQTVNIENDEFMRGMIIESDTP